MSIEFIDNTGKISSIKDIEESIKAVEIYAVKNPMTVPELTLQIVTLLQCLNEYLALRKNIENTKNE